MPSLKIWIGSARPRTLPLALAVTGMGNLLVFKTSEFNLEIFWLSILTTLFLQILSNFANDYGDSLHGADGEFRKGPSRAVQRGIITKAQMMKAIILFASLSLLSGLFLLFVSFRSNLFQIIPLLGIGLFSIAAAYFYTNGKKPYGYMALGDLSVFLFFGLVAVLATSYLHTKTIQWQNLFPAFSMGFWSVAVLNLNNMRDVNSDQAAGKFTVPIFLGYTNARIYQTILVVGGMVSLIFFGILTEQLPMILGAFPGIAIMIMALVKTWKVKDPVLLDPFLKPQALGTFLAVSGMFLVAIL